MTGRLLVTRGLPASGKTTWARGWVDADLAGRARVNRDDLRRMLHGRWIGTPEQETTVTCLQHGAVTRLLRTGTDVIVDDTNLRPDVMQGWHEFADILGVTVELKDFSDVDLEECVRRNAARSGADRVPEMVIRDMHFKYLAGQVGTESAPNPPAVDRG